MTPICAALFVIAGAASFGTQQVPLKCTDGRLSDATIMELVKNHTPPERIKSIIDQCVAGKTTSPEPQSAGTQQAPVKCTSGRLSDAAIIDFVRNHISPERIKSIIDQCHVSFLMTPEIRARLKNAGVT